MDNPAKIVFRQVKAMGRAAGVNVTPLRNVDRKVIGVEVRLASHATGNVKGEIVNTSFLGRPVSWFVTNQADVIQAEHHRGHFYEPEELEIISKHFPGGVFLDVGANVGNHSVFALKYLGAERVIAIEPNPDAYGILKVNIALNDLSDRFQLHAVGLSDKAGTAGMRRYQDNLGGTVLDESAADGGLPIVTGDSLLAETPVSFVKVDAEGMELAVLRGLENTIRRDRPAIFVEVRTRNAAELTAWSEARDYRSAAEFSRYPECVNYMLVPS